MGNISVETEIGSLVPKLHLALSPFVQKYSVAFFEIHSFPFFFFFSSVLLPSRSSFNLSVLLLLFLLHYHCHCHLHVFFVYKIFSKYFYYFFLANPVLSQHT